METTIKLFTFLLILQVPHGLKIPSFLEKVLPQLNNTVNEEVVRKKIFETMALHGMKNNYSISYITAVLAVRNMEMGNLGRAKMWYEISKEISPDMPTPSYLYAKGLWSKGISGFFESFVPQLEYVIKKYTNPLTSIEINQVWWEELFYFSIFMPLILVVFIGLKVSARIYHFFNEWFSFMLSGWGVAVFIIFLLTVPILVGVPAGYLVIGYIVFFSFFVAVKEWKTLFLTILSIVLFTASAFFCEKASIYFSPVNVSYIMKVLNYYSGNWDVFSQSAKVGDNVKSEEMFLDGLYFLKTGKYEKAYLVFDELLKRGYQPWKCYNNLGIVNYAMGEKEEALRNLKKSLEIHSLFNPEANYNLSVIYFERAQVEEGEKALNKAKEEGGEIIKKFSAFTSKESINTIFIPSELSTSEIKSGLDGKGYMPYIKEKYSFLFPDFSFRKLILTGICGVLLILVSLLPFVKNAFPQNCARCGKIYCARCEESPLPDLCYTCYTIYITKEKIAPEERIKFEVETSRRLGFKRWRRRTLNFILPGGGDIVDGKDISGAIKIGILLLIVITFAGENFTRGMIPFSLEITPFEYIVRGVVALFIWAFTNIRRY